MRNRAKSRRIAINTVLGRISDLQGTDKFKEAMNKYERETINGLFRRIKRAWRLRRIPLQGGYAREEILRCVAFLRAIQGRKSKGVYNKGGLYGRIKDDERRRGREVSARLSRGDLGIESKKKME